MDQSAAAIAEPGRPSIPLAVANGVRAVLREMRRDWVLYAIMLAYLAVAWWLSVGMGRPQFFRPGMYLSGRLPALILALAWYLMLVELPCAIRDEPRAPVTRFIKRLWRHANPKFIAGLGLFFGAAVFTGTFTCIKGLLNVMTPFWADAPLAHIDAALHFGVDPWRFLQPLLGHHWVTRALQNFYLNGWVMLLVLFTAAMSFSARLEPLRHRFFLTFFAAWIVLGNILAGAFMSGGPVYFGEFTGDHQRFAEQIRYLAFSDDTAYSSVRLQHMLWKFYSEGSPHAGTGISAFPSLHVAMMTLFTLTAFEIDKRLGLLIAALAGVILIGSVHLAWHYAIDGYVSAVFVLAVWFGLKRWLKPAA